MARIPAPHRLCRRDALGARQRRAAARQEGACRGSSTATPRWRRSRGEAPVAATAPRPRPGRCQSRRSGDRARTRQRSRRRHALPRRRIRPGKALARRALRGARAPIPRRRSRGVADRVAERQGRPAKRSCGEAGRRGARDSRPDRPHGSRHRDRPPVAGVGRRQQRFGPDARGRGGRRAARRAVRLVVARLHAADVGRGEDRADRDRLQPLLQARVPARTLQVHARSRSGGGV